MNYFALLAFKVVKTVFYIFECKTSVYYWPVSKRNKVTDASHNECSY